MSKEPSDSTLTDVMSQKCYKSDTYGQSSRPQTITPRQKSDGWPTLFSNTRSFCQFSCRLPPGPARPQMGRRTLVSPRRGPDQGGDPSPTGRRLPALRESFMVSVAREWVDP